MDNHEFQIPPEFEDRLRYREVTDTRIDAEILDSLIKFKEVSSEKNVWAFWDKGVEKLPAWCQRNVINWIRLLDSSWTVRVIDSVPNSNNYMLKYLPASDLNDAILKGMMDGNFLGPHSADLVRGACIYRHGGVFMDVGCVLFRDLDRLCWNQLSDSTSPYQVAAPWMFGATIANHFVAGRKGDPFIKRWHELFLHIWKDRTNSEGLIEDPLLFFAKHISGEDLANAGFHWDWAIPVVKSAEYVAQIMCWSRICMLNKDIGDGFRGEEYWQKHILVWRALQEHFPGEYMLGFVGAGQKMFDLLALPLDTDPESNEYKQASDFVWHLLSNSTMMKITHAAKQTVSTHLGVLWDEHPGMDCVPGTFGELLRYGSTHFEQTWRDFEYVQAPEPPITINKGVLEP